MKTCETCKYWDTSKTTFTAHKLNRCLAIPNEFNGPREIGNAIILVGIEIATGELLTKASFGCTEHEEVTK